MHGAIHISEENDIMKTFTEDGRLALRRSTGERGWREEHYERLARARREDR